MQVRPGGFHESHTPATLLWWEPAAYFPVGFLIQTIRRPAPLVVQAGASIFHRRVLMSYNEKMFSRQIGRNTQLFAQAVGALETPEARYPYLRILVSVIEQVRPEWVQVPEKEQLFTHLINEMTETTVAPEEIARVIAVRDAERKFLQDIAAGKVAPRPKSEQAQAQQRAATAPDAAEPASDAPTEAPTSGDEGAGEQDAASEADAPDAEAAVEGESHTSTN